jgi:hypothetical protein
LVGKLEGRRPLEKKKKKLVVNVRINMKVDLKETGCKSMDYIDLVQVRDNWWAVVNAVSFSRRTLLYGVCY